MKFPVFQGRFPWISSARRLRRVLFLDDDPDRAATFREQCSDAVWVQTAEECIARLEESWDEVHLDHDLGGEKYVDVDRDDCGMAVVRWLCAEPRPHLRKTWFYVHSHNTQAACIMILEMLGGGYRAEGRPFGVAPAEIPPSQDPRLGWPVLGRLVERVWQETVGRRLRHDQAKSDSEAKPQ